MSAERERLLTAFFAAAAVDGEWVRDWAKGDSVAEWAHPKAGDDVQMDGDFNIWAGIQAVVAQSKAEALEEAARYISQERSYTLARPAVAIMLTSHADEYRK